MPGTDFGADRKTPGGYGGSAANTTGGMSSGRSSGNSDSGSRYTGSGASGVNSGSFRGSIGSNTPSRTTNVASPGKAVNQAPPTKVVNVVSNLPTPTAPAPSYPKFSGVRGGHGIQAWDSTAGSPIGNARPKPIQDRVPGKQITDRVPQEN